jgi:hypothetical protein
MSSGGSYFDYAAGKQDVRQGRRTATAKPIDSMTERGVSGAGDLSRSRTPAPPRELPLELQEQAGDGTTIIKAIRGAILRKLARGE